MYGSPPAKDLNRPFLQTHSHQMSSGLLRYRSAPSSLFGEVCEDFLPVRPTSPETETMLARFLSPDLRDEIRDKQQQPPPPPSSSSGGAAAFSSAASRMLYQQHQQQQQQQITSNLITSMAMETDQIKNGGSNNLVRQSSSPAGLFSHLNVDTGYGVMRGIGVGSRLKSQLSFSSRQSSSGAAVMSQISEEMENESMGGYPIGSWEDSPMLSENNFSGGLKRARDNQSQLQNGDVRNGLTHQFSLPKTSMEMAAIEKFLQFQDSVPCKIRAKRGCATHPRSIAERVRRTRISERMRKLQELVPNMDKQTNTADMLDLAVDYIKELQKQVKIVSDSRANCSCSSSKQKPYANSTA